MMKRILLAALAALSIVAPASARVMVVVPKLPAPDVNNYAGYNNTISRYNVFNQVLKTMGASGNYFLVNQANVATEYARTGIMVWPNGNAEALDGVILLDPTMSSMITQRCRPDSITRVARGGSLVPTLFVYGDYGQIFGGMSGAYFSSVAARFESTGVANGAGPVPGPYGEGCYTFSDPTKRFMPQVAIQGMPITVTVPGGIRKLMACSTLGQGIQNYQPASNPQWPDSMPFAPSGGLGVDTCVVWDRLWANLASCPTARIQEFLCWAGGGLLNTDSVFSATSLALPGENEGNLQVLTFGLAHFDSLIGGKLFTRGPKTAAIVVEGGLARNQQWFRGGIDNKDTTQFYQCIRDSAMAYGIRLTVGINADSAATYARDLIVMKQNPYIRYAPYIIDGVRDTSAATIGASAGVTNNGRLVDVWGRNRTRAFYGDSLNHTIQTADTSLVQMLRRQMALVDSLAPGRSVRFGLPPDDDWSPKQMGSAAGAGKLDSLLWAIDQAGYVGVLANGQWDEANGNTNNGPGYTNPRGWVNKQGAYPNRYNGHLTNILCHAGSGPGMGKKYEASFNDSSGANTNGAFGYVSHELDRAYGAIFNDEWLNEDEWHLAWTNTAGTITFAQYKAWDGIQIDLLDNITHPRRGSVVRLFCSDFSGSSVGPARCGFWIAKSIKQHFDMVNAAHGVYGPLLTLTYPDAVLP